MRIILLFGYIFKYLRKENHEFHNKTYMQSNIEPNIPKEKVLSEKRSFFNFKKNTGCDERFNITDETIRRDNDILLNITHFNTQMDILRKLENENISNIKKMQILEQYEYFKESSKYIYDITKGGLFDDFNNVNSF
jgi:hypothetical protein